MKNRLLVLVVGALALAVGITAGGAYSYWTASGAGSGSGDVDVAQAVTVVAAAQGPSVALVPGGTADLVLRLENPNGYPVRITGISQRGTTVTPVGATGPGTACTGVNTGVSVPTQTHLDVPVASGADVTVHIEGAVAMSTSSASGCQGATFQVPVDVVVER